MTSKPTQPVEPLTEIASTSNITAAADGMLEDDEALWKHWCSKAGVPEAYTPPGKSEAGRVAKKAKEAKRKRHRAMRMCIAQANAAAAPAGGTLEPPPPQPPQAGAGPSADAGGTGAADAAAPDAAAPEVDSASAARMWDEFEKVANDAKFLDNLQVAVEQPHSRVARMVMKTILPLIAISSRPVPWGAVERGSCCWP